MSNCYKDWTIQPSSCPCILKLATPQGVCMEFCLEDLKIFPNDEAFKLQDQLSTLHLSNDGQITIEEIDALRCACHESSSTTIFPENVITTAFAVDCDGNETGDEGLAVVVKGAVEVCSVLGLEGDLAPTEYCDENCNPIFLCKVLSEETGEIEFIPHVWLEGADTLEPYSGPREKCGQCDCQPYSTSQWCDQLVNTEPYNVISIYNPTCCPLTLTISSGTHIVPSKVEDFCLEFDCLLGPEIEITMDESEAECDKSKILVTIVRKT